MNLTTFMTEMWSALPALMALSFFGNEVGAYLQAIAFGLFLVVVFWFLRLVVIQRLAAVAPRTALQLDDLVCHLAYQIKWPLFLLLAFSFSFQFLHWPGEVTWLLHFLSWLSLTVIAVLLLQQVVDYFIERTASRNQDAGRAAFWNTVGTLAKGALWVLGFLLLLSNVGINVYSLVAGLGVSGIIVAFALQNVLQDLFDSIAIHVDRPFEPGDFIVVKDYMGSVEKVGLKSTRIRSLSGEQIIIPNSELTSSKIQNYRRMERRRVQFSFGVGLETPNAQLEQLPAALQNIIESLEHTTFNRVHLAEIESYALRFVVVYHIEDSDYTLYRDIHQQVLLGLKQYLEQEKISLPYPTKTILVHK